MSADENMSQAVRDAAAAAELSTLEACAGFEGPLLVKGADRLSGLEHFTSLRGLEIVGGDFEDLGPLAGLRSLRALKIVCAKVRDLSPLAGLTELESFEINYTFVEDLSAIAALRALGWLALYGNPLDEKSFHEILERKRTTRVERWGRPCIVEASGEDEWKMCRSLFQAVPTVVWGRVAEGRPLAGAAGPHRRALDRFPPAPGRWHRARPLIRRSLEGAHGQQDVLRSGRRSPGRSSMPTGQPSSAR